MPEVEPAIEQPAGRVTVATFPFTTSFAAGQLAPNPLKMTLCPAAIEKFGLKTTLIVLDGASAPDGEVVKPTVQVEVAPAAVDSGEKLAPFGADASAIPDETKAPMPLSAARPRMVLVSRMA